MDAGPQTPDATGRSLSGQHVLVTGGSSGLGRAIVERLRALGACPIVLDVVAPQDQLAHVLVDLADTATTERVVAELCIDPGIDAVVTCAGVDRPGPLGAVPRDEWERVLRVNLFGTAAVIRSALPSLIERRGNIVTVASTLGHQAVADATAYCASKWGVVGFSRSLMTELKGRVGVTMLTPGGMDTSFFDGREAQYRPPADAVLADPSDVADAVCFVLTRPVGFELRELVVAASTEPTWP